jgi:hypothetical protein
VKSNASWQRHSLQQSAKLVGVCIFLFIIICCIGIMIELRNSGRQITLVVPDSFNGLVVLLPRSAAENAVIVPDRGDITLIVPPDGRLIVRDDDLLTTWHSMHVRRGKDTMSVLLDPNMSVVSDEGVWAYMAEGPDGCIAAIYVGSLAGLQRSNEAVRQQNGLAQHSKP